MRILTTGNGVKIDSVTLNATGHTFCNLEKIRLLHPTGNTKMDSVYNDSSYNNIDRSDENYAFISNNREKKLEQLTHCIQPYGEKEPGFQCGDKCMKYADWCFEHENCGTFFSDDSVLCSNTTFWKSVPCSIDDFWFTTNIYSDVKGIRCPGKKHQCIFPWYTFSKPDFYHRHSCDDKSDQLFLKGKKCSDLSKGYVKKYESLWCNDTNLEPWERYDGRLTCASNKGQIDNEIMYSDPHNCKDSCAEPSQDCISCSNPKYFTCDIDGQLHCIHPHLVCDGQPQCDGGKDEENCLEQYRKDAGKDATHICDNIFYPGISIYQIVELIA